MATKERNIPALTGIRAVAAFLVYIHHFNPLPKNELLGSLFHEFHVGVTLFFTLSGYLLYSRYNKIKLEKREILRYAQNRIARIFPIYLLLLVCYAIIKSWDFQFFTLQASLAKGVLEPYKFSGIAQAWSLSVEEMFYATLPLTLLFLRRKEKILSFLIPFAGALIFVLAANIANGKLPSIHFLLLYTFPGRILEFFSGIYFARKYIQGQEGKSILKPLIGFIFLVFIMASSKGNLKFGLYSNMGLVINNLLLPAFVFGPVLLNLSTQETLVSKILGSKVFVRLGQYSYIFYLIHMGPIQTFVSAHLNPIWTCLVIWAISGTLYHLIESPANRLIRKIQL